MKKIFIMSLMLVATASFSQTKEELKEQKAKKQAAANALQSEADALQKQIDNLPGWKFGAFGTVGASFSEFNNWYGQGTPNNASGNISVTVNPFAKLDNEKYFWYNTANINLSWVKFDDKDDPSDDDSFREANDVFNVTSLFGYKIAKNLAASTLAEYRTTLINNFNDPGYLDVGVGVTWTPISNLVVVVHPLNYNFVFADNDAIFDSSLGAKVVANYSRSFGKLGLNSNLSAFMSYKDSNLSNWTWINAVSYKLWKGIGLGFELGLRDNNQEAVNYAFKQWDPAGTNPEPGFDNVDNKLQVYTTFGLSYAF
ncbi:DUF3078 domain-containing protein [Bizionia argentinensis JUB59]|uniref:DUF3078 domain-containing protein n=1 Tax=Bizionia argentinensis JUB59 TaxID=1046627 RepID=G2EH74_9FLAO|nr:DUF3078 domain-containing protein [Bizionia argentinensis]EGV42144.2 DUF3078 domain-containing protein [Bizionia argentinensis JUB59]